MPIAAILVREIPGLPVQAQRTAALACAARHGLPVGRAYLDDLRRPRCARQALLRDGGTKIGVLVVATVSALGSTMREIVALVADLRAREVQVIIADRDEATSANLGAAACLLAEAQVALRVEAAKRGRQKAKARGVRFGRPPIPAEKAERARAALAGGSGLRAAARAAGISPASTIRLRARATG